MQKAKIEDYLVDFAVDTTFASIPQAAVRAAKARIIDSIGVAIAAYSEPPIEIARRVAQPSHGPRVARIWGSQVSTTVDMAAFVNGTMVRYLDFNDAWRTKDGHHPSDYLPAILALGEALGCTGSQTITALAVCYEVICRFADAVSFNNAGWDQPVTGAIGTALAAGNLLRLPREQMKHALSLAVVPNLCLFQTRSGELSMWKGVAGPNGARNAIFAALLAAEGMTGPEHPLSGEFGLCRKALDGVMPEIAMPAGEKSWGWGITQSILKKFPVRDSCQLPILTALELRAKLGNSAISSIEIETYQTAWDGAIKDKELWAPKTRETADHSMLFSVACTLLDGAVTTDSFARGRFRDADILDLIGRIGVDVIEEFTDAAPNVRNCRITGVTQAGAKHVVHKAIHLADHARSLSDEEIEAKFIQCTAKGFDEERRAAVLREAWRFDEIANVGRFIDLIAV